MKFNRRSKNGTIQRIFEEMQNLNIIDVRTDTLCIDSTSIKVHSDAAGVRKSNGKQSIGRSKYDRKLLINFSWTEPVKIIKPVLQLKNTGFMLLFLQRRTVTLLGSMIKNFKKEIIQNAVFSESSVSEKFLHAMIHQIPFFFGDYVSYDF